MKKLILGFISIFIITVSAYGYGVLTGEQNNGMKKICFYSDGSALTVGGAELCPLSVD